MYINFVLTVSMSAVTGASQPGGGGGGGHLDNLYIISSVRVYQSSDVAYRQSHQLASAPALAEKLPL